MANRIRGIWVDWVFAIVLATVALSYAVYSGVFWRLDHGVYDELINFQKVPASDDIVVVAIDDESIASLGGWPWPRQFHARLLNRLAEAQPKAILYDILFVDPSPHDAELAAAIARTKPIIPLYFEVPGRGGGEVTTVMPQAALIRAGAVVGHANLSPDADGVVRQTHLRAGGNGTIWPHVADLIVCRAQHTTCPSSATVPGQHVVQEYPFYIPFRGNSDHYRQVPFSAVLEGSVPASFFKDRIVLVGSTTTSLGDSLATPLSKKQALMPGIELNANIAQALVEGRSISPAPAWARYLLALIPVYALLALFLVLRPRQSFVATLTLGLLAIAVSILLWFGGIWLSPVPALAGLTATYLLWAGRRLQVSASYMREELERFRRDAELHITPKSSALSMPDRELDQLRDAIAESRDLLDFLRDTLDGLPDSSLILASDGTIDRVNSRAKSVLGAVEGQHFSRVISRISAGQFLVPATATPEDNQLPSEISDNTGRTFDVRWAKINMQEKSPIWVLRLADVTELRVAMRQREEALKLLTHDMRSPQVSIITLLDHQKDKVDGELRRRIGDYAHRTLALADGFVDLARAQARKLVIDEVNYADIVQDAVDALWPQATAKKITLATQGTDLEMWGWADRELLTRAMINLIDNAIKYSPADTTVTCTLAGNGTEAIMSICDQGEGIPADRIDSLFLPFDRAGRQDQNGAGLGLAFVHSVAERHGARLLCTSTLGKGTCFTLKIALEAAHHPQ
jgi:CHASE2 domain-containing sensor protein/signal transduction histidine kinase